MQVALPLWLLASRAERLGIIYSISTIVTMIFGSKEHLKTLILGAMGLILFRQVEEKSMQL